jgi:lipoprotein-anchoring transpeptidase ErfK/SrfK
VKPLIALFLSLGTLFATQVFAEDATPQPLTRADCEATSGWSWSETANVCERGSNDMAVLKSQPLTRGDCEQAGMSWNDYALVCDDGSARKATAADTANPVGSSILITIDKATQNMTVLVDGVEKYDWPVSTGKRGYSTPSGTYTTTSMNEIWYSKEWDNAPMPHAIFFMKDGHAIHGSYEVKHLGQPASHGCVRIAPQNATILYDLVKKTGLENTQVVLIGETPGGESKVASSGKVRTSRAWPDNSFAEADNNRRRGGFFRRLFGAR